MKGKLWKCWALYPIPDSKSVERLPWVTTLKVVLLKAANNIWKMWLEKGQTCLETKYFYNLVVL